MAHRGWLYPFYGSTWEALAARYADLGRPELGHVEELIQSIIGSSLADRLVGLTSMFDLVVAQAPATNPPFDVIHVRSPFSLRRPGRGLVVIEHVSTTGYDDRIERATSETVPLFWRFVSEKWGLRA